MFRASEIFDFALAIEKNGQAFYQAMAALAKDERVKELFQRLAEEEAQHFQDFGRLKEKVTSYNPPESYPGEYEAYMKALVNSHIFSQKLDPEALAQGISSDQEALDLAIQLEKDALLFFTGLRNLVSYVEVKFVDELLAQERKHLCELHSLRHS